MTKLKAILLDLLKCIKVGSIISVALILVGGLVSLIASKANIPGTLEGIRAVLFVVGSLGLLIGAAMLLKTRIEKDSEYMEEWKKKFKVLKVRYVIISISSLLIIYGCLIDWILFQIR